MGASTDSKPAASCEVIASGRELRLKIAGDLTARSIAPVWKQCAGQIKHVRKKSVIIDAGDVRSCDGAGIGLLTFLMHTAKQRQASVEIVDLRQEFKQLMDRFAIPTDQPVTASPPLNVIEVVGKLSMELLEDIYEQIAFLANVLVTGLRLAVQPWRFRWNDFFYIAENAGVYAFGIVALLGFLFGLIISFSSAMPLKQFGVEIYVSDLVAYGLMRVLGPILTAIIVAGRTGSAYAAELGTMKINHEIDALQVMNLDPVAFLVLPRVLATTIMTPLLTISAIILGLAGSAVVILSMGYPLVAFASHVQSILTIPDVIVGLVKSVVYGAMIGMVGCLRGLQTKIGAGAVGVSTTRAVVTAIILLVILEGIFSVLLYFLDI